MNKVIANLTKIIQELSEYEKPDTQVLDLILLKIDKIDKSWSGSILGYQRNVYYRNFHIPPEGAYFSQEWGIELHPLMKSFNEYSTGFLPKQGSIGDWVEYPNQNIGEFIFQDTDMDRFNFCVSESQKSYELFLKLKEKSISYIHANNIGKLNPYLEKVVSELEQLDHLKAKNYYEVYIAKFGSKTYNIRDFKLLQSSITASPPYHIQLQGKIIQYLSEFHCLDELKEILFKIQEHLLAYHETITESQNKMSSNQNITITGTNNNIVVGNGNSQSISQAYESVFSELISIIKNSQITDDTIKHELISLVNAMETTQKTTEFNSNFKKFMQVLGTSADLLNHAGKFIPYLTNLLN